MDEVEQTTRLGFTLPANEVIASNFAAGIDVGAFAYSHVGSRNDKGHRRLTRICEWDPIRNRNVVGVVAKLDWDCALERY